MERHDPPPPAEVSVSVALPDWLAIVLVTATSAAVLILEILASRLVAPYVGANLETYTAIIGTILAGIAAGAWAGGVLADRVDPHRLLPPMLTVGGALAIASIPVVRALGGSAGPGSLGAPSVLLAAAGFLPCAAVLSAVPPAVIKLQLQDLETTGTTVGRLSAWSTAGAIGGTFLAGFVLVAYAAVTTLIVSVGLCLILGGAVLWGVGRRRQVSEMLSAGALALVSIGGVAYTDAPCDLQTAYYCVSIAGVPDVASARVLVLDDLRHSYVDLDDPTHLEFWYVRQIVGAIETLAPATKLDIVSLGGGAFTVPRYIRATRPGSDQVVLELDEDLVDLVESQLAFEPDDDVHIVVGDGRLSMRDLPTDSADVIVGDAFGKRAVPWHLATVEFMADIARVLRPGGIYAANIIDGPKSRFLAAEAATVREVMPFVAVLEGPNVVDGFAGNSVLVASAEPIDVADWEAARIARGDGGALMEDLASRLDRAQVLTDDFAPVDQLISTN